MTKLNEFKTALGQMKEAVSKRVMPLHETFQKRDELFLSLAYKADRRLRDYVNGVSKHELQNKLEQAISEANKKACELDSFLQKCHGSMEKVTQTLFGDVIFDHLNKLAEQRIPKSAKTHVFVPKQHMLCFRISVTDKIQYWAGVSWEHDAYLLIDDPFWSVFELVAVFKKNNQSLISYNHGLFTDYMVQTNLSTTVYRVDSRPGLRESCPTVSFVKIQNHVDEVVNAVINMVFESERHNQPVMGTPKPKREIINILMVPKAHRFVQFNMYGENCTGAAKRHVGTISAPTFGVDENTIARWMTFTTQEFDIYVEKIPFSIVGDERIDNRTQLENLKTRLSFAPDILFDSPKFKHLPVFGYDKCYSFETNWFNAHQYVSVFKPVETIGKIGDIDVACYPTSVDYANSFATWYPGSEDPLLQPLINKGQVMMCNDARIDLGQSEHTCYYGGLTGELYNVTGTQRLLNGDVEYPLTFKPLLSYFS